MSSNSADWQTSYIPGDAESGKFVKANTSSDVFQDYPSGSMGKFVMLTYDVSSQDVDFSQPYVPFQAEDGKFVRIRSDSTLLSGYPSAIGMGKYAVLTYNLNPSVVTNTIVQAASAYYTVLTGAFMPLSGGSMTGNLYTPVLATTAVSGTSYIDFNLSPTSVVLQEGRMFWNTTDGTLNLGMPGGNVNLQIGQEQILRCRNQTGSPISNGQVVYINGAYNGEKPLIALASATDEIHSHTVLGVATENIAHNSNGYVTLVGMVRDINTSLLNEGEPVYLGDTAGSIVSAAPTFPSHQVLVGYCIKQHASTGVVLVNIDLGTDLEDVHNVSITSPRTNDVLSYVESTSSWTNMPMSGAISQTSTNVERVFSTFTVNTTSSILMVNASAAAVSAYLPTASTQNGRRYTFKKIDDSTNYVVLSANTYIDGGYTFSITSQYNAIEVVSDGSQWWII